MDKWNFARFFAAVGSNSTRWTFYDLGSDEGHEAVSLQNMKLLNDKKSLAKVLFHIDFLIDCKAHPYKLDVRKAYSKNRGVLKIAKSVLSI